MGPPAEQRATVADYLAAHEASAEKLEFVDGQIIAMTGGSYAHTSIIDNLFFTLRLTLRGRPCRAHSSEARFRSPVFRSIRYPDGQVICGDVIFDEDDPDAITNPTAVFEVLSPSTEATDRGDKAIEYRSTPSVQHVVFVSSRRRHVEVLTRQPDDTWLLTEAGSGTLALSALELQLDVEDLYEGVSLE